MAHLKLKTLTTKHPRPEEYSDVSGSIPRKIYVVLFGKTGNGKSATGNTILGADEFAEVHGSMSGTDVVSVKKFTEGVFTFNIFDYPGVSGKYEMFTENAKIIMDAPDGIHVFIAVGRCDDRLMDEEVNYIEKFNEHFGGGIREYTLLVATHRATTSSFGYDDAMTGRLFRIIPNRGLAVENRDRDGSKTMERNKLLCAILEVVHLNGGKSFSNAAFKAVDPYKADPANTLKRSIASFMRGKSLSQITEINKVMESEGTIPIDFQLVQESTVGNSVVLELFKEYRQTRDMIISRLSTSKWRVDPWLPVVLFSAFVHKYSLRKYYYYFVAAAATIFVLTQYLSN